MWGKKDEGEVKIAVGSGTGSGSGSGDGSGVGNGDGSGDGSGSAETSLRDTRSAPNASSVDFTGTSGAKEGNSMKTKGGLKFEIGEAMNFTAAAAGQTANFTVERLKRGKNHKFCYPSSDLKQMAQHSLN